METTATVRSVVRGVAPGPSIELRVSTRGSEVPSPPPGHSRIMAAMVETPSGWRLSHTVSTWRITGDDRLEVGKLRVPISNLHEALSRAMGGRP